MEFPEHLAFLLSITLLAGIVRGLTGFGGALVMAPFFTTSLGSTASVVVIVLVHMLTSLQGLSHSLRVTEWRAVAPLLISSFIALPLGIWSLHLIDPVVVKRLAGATCVAFSLAMLLRIGFRAPATRMKSIFVGLASGALNGLTGMGGPPAVLYMLSWNNSARGYRANFISFFAILYGATFVLLMLSGAVTWSTCFTALLLGPAYFLATILGSAIFRKVHGDAFIPICSVLLLGIGAGSRSKLRGTI
ncbi:MAG: sulfite exporter TauE/SafE family protein [Thiobacillus sp.]